jgi:predicted amidohydrolase YtcJ
MDALRIIYAAVSRKKEGERRTVRLRSLSLRAWYPQECLSLPEAIFAYTQGASYASYEEKIKGSIEIGKLADMVVLSQDIFEVNPEEILQTKVESTILGGKIVTNFEKE